MKTKVADSEVSFLNLNQDLIAGCKKGDQKAQFQIYKLYYKAMYNTSLRIVNDTMEAEDIMQESFLAAFDKIETYSGTVAFGAWLKKIVQNRSIDALNRKNKMICESIDSFLFICSKVTTMRRLVKYCRSRQYIKVNLIKSQA